MFSIITLTFFLKKIIKTIDNLKKHMLSCSRTKGKEVKSMKNYTKQITVHCCTTYAFDSTIDLYYSDDNEICIIVESGYNPVSYDIKTDTGVAILLQYIESGINSKRIGNIGIIEIYNRDTLEVYNEEINYHPMTKGKEVIIL